MSTYSRRRFLEDSLLAAATAMGAAGTRRGWSAEPSGEARRSANERLSVAVIGVHGQGNAHLEQWSTRPDTEVTYICDVDEEVGRQRVEETAVRQGRKPKYVRDLREVFDDAAVDLVSTATPNHWHALVAIWAMQAGKDVYVEKPVSHNVSEGRRMVETARQHGRICQTGTQCRSMPGTIEAIDYIKAGKIGDVTIARGLCYKRRKSIGPRGVYAAPASVDFNLWTGPAPLGPLTRPKLHYDWHWQWATGNGDLGNQGIHQMDIARWGLGFDTLSQSVVSYGGRLGYEDAGETANTQVIEHDFGGKKLIFEVRGLETDAYRGAGVGVVFHGTDGYVVLDSYTHGAAFDRQGKPVAEFSGGKYGYHFDNFVAAVRSRKHEQLHADILQGHLSSALCHLGNISLRLGNQLDSADCASALAENGGDEETFNRLQAHLKANGVDPAVTKVWFGQRLHVDTESETLVDNHDANAMLTREYRAPFIVPAAGQA